MTSNNNNNNFVPPSRIRSPLCTYYSSGKEQLLSELRWCFDYFPRRRPPPSAAAAAAAAAAEEASAARRRDDRSSSLRTSSAPSPPPPSCSIPFLLLPHGALCDSGPLVAEALLELDETSDFFANQSPGITVVLVGTEHDCTARKFLCLDGGFRAWRTPLGDVPTDWELVRKLSNVLPIEMDPFLSEHSIENQLPFLQYLAATRRRNTALRILPISVRGFVSQEEFRDIVCGDGILPAVAEILREHRRTTQSPIAVVATTDFSHVGPAYGFVPHSSETIPDCIRRLDNPVVQAVESNDLERLFAAGSASSMCGLGAALVWMRLLHLLGGMKEQKKSPHIIRRLRHIVGSDIGPQHSDQTGFATFIAS